MRFFIGEKRKLFMNRQIKILSILREVTKMKKCKILVATILVLLFFAGCTGETKLHNENSSETTLPAKLIVNGKDITEGNYVYINVEKEQAEVPLLAIVKELGAEVEWIDENIVEISYEDKSKQIDKNDKFLGIMIAPGGKPAVRKQIDNDFVYNSGAIFSLLRAWFNADITVDYKKMIVEVYYMT